MTLSDLRSINHEGRLGSIYGYIHAVYMFTSIDVNGPNRDIYDLTQALYIIPTYAAYR